MAVPPGKLIAARANVEKEGRPHIQSLTFHLQKLEQEEHSKDKASRMEKVLNSGAELEKIGKRKPTEPRDSFLKDQ